MLPTRHRRVSSDATIRLAVTGLRPVGASVDDQRTVAGVAIVATLFGVTPYLFLLPSPRHSSTVILPNPSFPRDLDPAPTPPHTFTLLITPLIITFRSSFQRSLRHFNPRV